MNHDFEDLVVCEIRINPDNEKPELFTIIMENEKDVPIMKGGMMLLFSNFEKAVDALEASDNVPQDLRVVGISKERGIFCDVAGTLYLIENGGVDPEATIIGCLNVLFDLAKAIKYCIPDKYKNILYGLADHLTFEKEFSSYFEENEIERREAADGIFMCLGAIISKSIIRV